MNALLAVFVLISTPAPALAASDSKAILSELSKHPELISCYTESGEEKKGTVVVEWEVNDKGDVPNAKATIKSSIRNLGIHLCLTSRLKMIKFPAAPAGKTIPVSYTFDFSK